MNISRPTVVFDAADLDAESTFWAALLGGTVDKDDDWHTITVDGEPRVAIQLAADHVQPDWPDGAPQQVHLDFDVDDIHAAHEHAVSVGARVLQRNDMDARRGFVAYADPAGHPFCLCWS